MSDIILKTYEFLDELDKSVMIKNLVMSKEKLLKNEEILVLIKKYNDASDEDRLTIKKKIYENDDYKQYMSSYNELALLVMKINMRYKEYTSSRKCSNIKERYYG